MIFWSKNFLISSSFYNEVLLYLYLLQQPFDVLTVFDRNMLEHYAALINKLHNYLIQNRIHVILQDRIQRIYFLLSTNDFTSHKKRAYIHTALFKAKVIHFFGKVKNPYIHCFMITIKIS